MWYRSGTVVGDGTWASEMSGIGREVSGMSGRCRIHRSVIRIVSQNSVVVVVYVYALRSSRADIQVETSFTVYIYSYGLRVILPDNLYIYPLYPFDRGDGGRC